MFYHQMCMYVLYSNNNILYLHEYDQKCDISASLFSEWYPAGQHIL